MRAVYEQLQFTANPNVTDSVHLKLPDEPELHQACELKADEAMTPHRNTASSRLKRAPIEPLEMSFSSAKALKLASSPQT